MPVQLRVYEIEPGRLHDFVAEWHEHVVPLRRAHGFEVVAAWASEQDDTFAWVIAHDGDFAAADATYYGSAERNQLEPDPARLIAAIVKTVPVTEVET
jgi:hypothetical protein